MNINHDITTSAATLRQRLGPAPAIAVLLGSGWSAFADQVEDAADIAYADLPAFPPLAVSGHRGLLRCGHVGSTRIAVLAGRKHAYESGRADAMLGAIRTLQDWGVKVLLQTNAAGSLHTSLRPGSLMLISDHLNLVQRSPLIGEQGDGRFVDMSAAYCPQLREQACSAALAAGGPPLPEGVYAWQLGPQFETPAEIRMIQAFGAQAVGMSTVPETIIARHAGLRVLALSMMTNMGAGIEGETLSHAHTLATASAASAHAVAVLSAVVQALKP